MKKSARKIPISLVHQRQLASGKDVAVRKQKPKAKSSKEKVGKVTSWHVVRVSGSRPAKSSSASQHASVPADPRGLELSRLQVHPGRETPAHVRGYGWTPSLRHIDSTPFDHESFGVAKPKRLAKSVDLRAGCPPVYDQAKLGSCTANAVSAALEFDLKRQGGKPFMPSRLYIYRNERAQLGTIGQDTGASIHLSTEVVRELGACHEADWPYLPARFAYVPCRKAYE
jgi:hypothetical protein